MIIPMRCFTCGKVLADKWQYYKKKSDELEADYFKFIREENEKNYGIDKDSTSLSSKNKKENEFFKNKKAYPNISRISTKEILDELGLNKICCRRHMIGHVDMMGKI